MSINPSNFRRRFSSITDTLQFNLPVFCSNHVVALDDFGGIGGHQDRQSSKITSDSCQKQSRFFLL